MLRVAECMHEALVPSGGQPRFEGHPFSVVIGRELARSASACCRAMGARKHAWRALWCSLAMATALTLACLVCNGV